jgi:hypothetical protein
MLRPQAIDRKDDRELAARSAQPFEEPDPRDPQVVLRALPGRESDEFLRTAMWWMRLMSRSAASSSSKFFTRGVLR